MSTLGKIFAAAALLGIIASLGAGYVLTTKYKDSQNQTATESQAKAAAIAESNKQKALALAAETARKDAETKLADSTTQVGTLTTQLSDAQKKADDASAALTQAKADGAKALADLDAINKQLDGKSVPDLIAARDKALADAQSAQSEQKIIADQLQAAQADVERMTKNINLSKIPLIPPGVSGKVTFVNRTWNFVVIDVGLNNSVVPNGTLIVYRKNQFLGKIKVTTADANSAVADILPDAKDNIQVGDNVVN